MSLNKRALGLILLTLTVALAMTGSAIYSGIIWEQSENMPEEELGFFEVYLPPPPKEGWDRVAPVNESSFKVLTFGPDFILPVPLIVPTPVLEMTNPIDNTTDCKALLGTYRLYWVDETTTVQEGPAGFLVSNEHNSTRVDYRRGTIEFNANDTTYEPATETEIKANSSLLNRSEALEVVVQFLKDHALYNASWQLVAQGGSAGGNVMEPEEKIYHYYLRFTPVLLGRTLSEPDGPGISVYINPLGEIYRLTVTLRDIKDTGIITLPTFPEPLDALFELEHNYFRYFLCANPRVHIVSMAPGYMADEDTPTWLVPCWAIRYNSGSSILEL